MITIDTHPQNPPRLWVLSPGRMGQFVVIENDHLVLTTVDRSRDRISRMPLREVVRIYVARERAKWTRDIAALAFLLLVLISPIWTTGGFGQILKSGLIVQVAGFLFGVVLVGGIFLMRDLYYNLRPPVLIYLISGSQAWGFRARFSQQKLAEFLDALSAAIIRCRQAPPDARMEKPPPAEALTDITTGEAAPPS
jgi:hypothetical protein